MVGSVKLLHPEYEYVFFDNDDVERFIDTEFPQYRPVFDGFRFPIQRYDFFRYLAVYRLGGFYFDLDILLAHELDPLLETGGVFPFEGLTFSNWLRARGLDWELGNYAFGAAPGHPFLEKVIRNCVAAQANPEAWLAPMMPGVPVFSKDAHYILYTTGPGQLTRTLAENPALANTMTVLFPEDVCDERTWHVFGTYGVHLMEGSWRPSTGFLRRRIAQRWEALALDRCIRDSRQRGRTRTLVTAVGHSNP